LQRSSTLIMHHPRYSTLFKGSPWCDAFAEPHFIVFKDEKLVRSKIKYYSYSANYLRYLSLLITIRYLVDVIQVLVKSKKVLRWLLFNFKQTKTSPDRHLLQLQFIDAIPAKNKLGVNNSSIASQFNGL